MVRTSIVKLIQSDHPAWNERSFICLDDLNLYHSRFVAKVLEEERGEQPTCRKTSSQSGGTESIDENTIARNPKTDVAQKIMIA